MTSVDPGPAEPGSDGGWSAVSGPPATGGTSEEFDASAVVELTSALVRLRTVHDGGVHTVEAPAVAMLADVMGGFGWDVTVTEVAPGRSSVVAVIVGQAGNAGPVGRATVQPKETQSDRTDPTATNASDGIEPAAGDLTSTHPTTAANPRPPRTLMFEGHVDVVTEGDRGDWSFDPYAGDIVAGRLRGRGSADMKSGVAAMIHAARTVELGGFVGRMVVGVLADEEGMMLGAKRFAADLMDGSIPPVDGVIVCEPEGGEVCPVAKGAIRITVTFHGEMAHGAMPKMGRNPLPAIGSLLIALTEIERGYQARIGTHPTLGDFSMTPTVLAAGSLEQLNVIPASAVLAIDVRTVPGIDHPQLIELVHSLADSLAAEHGLRAQVEVLDDRPPVNTPVDDPVVLAMLAGHRAATGVDAVLGGVPGTTDGTILTRDAGLPTVVYGPGGKWIAHQVDEFVEVAEIITCTRAYIAAARYFFAVATEPQAAGPTDEVGR